MASKWEKLDDVSQNIKDEPWSLYWNEMKTGTPEFEQFIHDPLSSLTGALAGVTQTWTVQTNILNHEAGLMVSHACQLALVDPGKNTVYLTIYKHLKGS
jgi:hypothetical protein